MADDLANLQASLKRLEKALTSGTLIVQHDGTSVTYKDTTSLLAAINYIKGQIAQAGGMPTRTPGVVVQTSKGYHP